MNREWVPIDREALLAELRKAFDDQIAEVLLSVLDKATAPSRDTGVLRDDFRELTEIVTKLATAQQKSEERLSRLEEQLTEAQARTEERMSELAKAQRQTNMVVVELAEGIDRLCKQVGGLSETLGGDIEDIAYTVLYDVLKREFGWNVGLLERSWETWDGEPEEVNVFGVARDPTRPGKTIWIVGEAKHNLTSREVQRFGVFPTYVKIFISRP